MVNGQASFSSLCCLDWLSISSKVELLYHVQSKCMGCHYPDPSVHKGTPRKGCIDRPSVAKFMRKMD